MKIRIYVLIAMLGIVFTACEKNNPVKEGFTEKSLQLVADEANATAIIDDIMKDIDFYSEIGEGMNLKSAAIDGGCPVITVERGDDNGWPRTVTIDFGDRCETRNGKVKSGKVIITKSAKWKEEGATRSVTFEEFYVNGALVEGTKNIINDGEQNGVWSFSINNSITITLDDTIKVSRTAVKTREFISGFDTPRNRADDLIHVSGTVTVNRNGKTYTREITSPLVINGACRFIVAGVVEITRNDEVITLDYGDGACDSKATISKGGETKEIDLAKRRRH
ncbi:hypothetical protein MNBD_BACTEROID01-385 [hydrothermal vent metagenome]|uniref:Lipoprotein n=1 Tax=hydrothermal vent metagenome TaxID=652676 RepID=A0A3B0U298_9ZZZZ